MSGGVIKGNGASIPPAARKMVQSLKEIVPIGELEIYAMLKDCNMDPDEAVNRLLSQDTFHEVKNKREKKKEMKEKPEPRPRAVNSSSNRGARLSVDRGGRYNSTQFSSNDYGVSRGKPANKKETETNTLLTSSNLGSGIAGNNLNRRSTGLSDSTSVEYTIQTTVADDGISSPSQPSVKFQQNWTGLPGHVSMADIVKMGRPQGKTSTISSIPSDPSYASYSEVIPSMSRNCANHAPATVQPSESIQESHYSQVPGSQVAEISQEVDNPVEEHISDNDWSLVEVSPEGNESNVMETSVASISYIDPSMSSASLVDEVDLQPNPQLGEKLVLEESIKSEDLSAEPIRSASVTDRHIQHDNPEENSQPDDGLLTNMSSYQTQRSAYEHEEDEEVNVAATNMQNLSLHSQELHHVTNAGDNPAVIIPSHLQVTSVDCSHLSFGSFGSGISATFSGSYPLKTQANNLEMPSVADAAPSLDHHDTRNLDYFDNDQLQSTSTENVASRSGTSTRNYDMPSASQPEATRNDTLNATHGLQYDLPSVSGYAFSTTAQQNTAPYTYPEANSQLQNAGSFTSLMHPYADSLPTTSLAQNVQPLREFDHPFSPLLTTQSMPTKYSTEMSTVGGSSISMAEVKPGVFSSPQPSLQTLPQDPRLTQHLSMHPYSQPTLPMGPFANMISYSFLPQSYTYLPTTAYQQAYANNTPFHQSPPPVQTAGMKYPLPQYKSSVSAPHSASVPSVYGGFGSSANIPGNFALNPSSTSANTTLGFDEALYKDGSHYFPHQQAENPAMWIHGAGSRTVSALPSSMFYSFQGQNQHNGFRQGQQPSNYGYPNLYHSQVGASGEHQPNPVEGNSSGSQSLPSQQSQQIWQHGY